MTKRISIGGFPTIMEHVIKSFNLPYTEFANLVQACNGIVAGGAALYAYLYPKGTGPIFTGDIDVWVQTDVEGRDGCPAGAGNLAALAKHLTEYTWTMFLGQHGYKQTEESKHGDYGGLRFSERIRRVLTYANGEGKKIQVILTFIPVMEVCKTFDFSACATWWNGRGPVKTLDPENTDRHYIYPLTDIPLTKKEKDRLEKYRKRGFTVFDAKPVPGSVPAPTMW